jgi:hypothetical protein
MKYANFSEAQLMKRCSVLSGKPRFFIAISCCALLGYACLPASAQQRSTTQARRVAPAGSNTTAVDANHPLDGAWRLSSALDPASGQLRPIPQGIEMTKLVVGGRFAWIASQNGRAVAGAGGTCSLTPNSYSETVSYAVGQNQQALIGTTTKFTWTFEGGKWHHKGTLRVGQNRQEIDEIWERISNGKQ